MARPGRPERNRAARSFRQLRRFHHGINSDKVFGTHSGYDPPRLQIAHDCPVAMVLAEGPVVNAGDDQRLRSRAGSSPNNPQQSVVAHWQHQSPGEARRRPAAECQPQMVDDAFQPCRPARPGRKNIVTEPFSENPPPTMRHLTNEPPRDYQEAYLLARR